MQGAGARITWWIISLTLLLHTESRVKHATHERRLSTPSGKSLDQRQVQTDFSISASGNSAGFYTEGPGYGGNTGTVQASSSSLPKSVQSTSPEATTPAVAPVASPVSAPQSCDKSVPKSAINQMLIACEAKVQSCSGPVVLLAQQVNKDNCEQIAQQIAAKLEEISTTLQAFRSSIQLCGNDPKPLSSNQGVDISDVSWSAFQVVLTLKPVFQAITAHYKQFPIVKSTCDSAISRLSTALAAIIGACGEQINLFDTRFFPLVAPQLKEFTDIGGDFVSFVGTFES